MESNTELIKLLFLTGISIETSIMSILSQTFLLCHPRSELLYVWIPMACFSTLHLRMLSRDSTAQPSLIGNMLLFLQLTLRPEQASNITRITLKLKFCAYFTSQKTTVSSAYSTCSNCGIDPRFVL